MSKANWWFIEKWTFAFIKERAHSSLDIIPDIRLSKFFISLIIKLLWYSIASNISEGIFKSINESFPLSLILIGLSLINFRSLSRSLGAASIYPYLLLFLFFNLSSFWFLLNSLYSSI